MRSVKVAFGLVVAGLLLSGCGSSGSGTSAATASLSSQASGSGPGAATGTATVSWSAPTANTNGSALTDLAGYHIHYGTSANSMTQEVDVQSAGTVSYTVAGLAAGTWYFEVSAYTTNGVESGLSTVGSKTIT